MFKSKKAKLSLRPETVRRLMSDDLQVVRGASGGTRMTALCSDLPPQPAGATGCPGLCKPQTAECTAVCNGATNLCTVA